MAVDKETIVLSEMPKNESKSYKFHCIAYIIFGIDDVLCNEWIK